MATRSAGAIVAGVGEAASETGIAMHRFVFCFLAAAGAWTLPATAQVADRDGEPGCTRGVPSGGACRVSSRFRPGAGVIAVRRGYRDAPAGLYGEIPPPRRPEGARRYRRGGSGLSYGYGYGGTGLGTYAPGGFNGPYPYGPAGGLAIYTPGAFGPGPRIIAIPDRYGE